MTSSDVVVPAFRHDDAGTDEAVWAADPRWSLLPAERLHGADGRPAARVVVVAAHPDDETLGAAGLMTVADAGGTDVQVVVVTDGEGSHPGSPTHSPDRLAALRREEVVAAVAACAPGAQVHVLGLPDGDVTGHEASLEAVLAVLVDESTLVLAPWRHDGHPDHEAAGRAAARVVEERGARLLEYPIWLWHWGIPDDLPWNNAVRLDLPDGVRNSRAAALGHHRTQYLPLSDAPEDAALLRPHVLAHFERPWETYLDAGTAAEDERATTFDAMYDDGDDPWQSATWYERRKRALCLAALPDERLGRVLEIGCATGVLTSEIAARAGSVLAVDHSRRALDVAARRLSDRPHVRLRQAALPRQWPPGLWDTIVLSEVGYFLDPLEVRDLLARAEQALSHTGAVLLCHWLHPVEGYPVQGEEVHVLAEAQPWLEVTACYRDADFRVDVLRRPDRPSVAEVEGLV